MQVFSKHYFQVKANLDGFVIDRVSFPVGGSFYWHLKPKSHMGETNKKGFKSSFFSY